LLVGAVLLRGAEQTNVAVYDGRWWLSISVGERSGFVPGYIDCYLFHVKGPADFAKPLTAYRDSVTKYYEADSAHSDQPVSQVLMRLESRMGAIPAVRGGEFHKGSHSYFDGLYWSQLGALGGVEQQRGFVEGYLSCQASVPVAQRLTFSNSADDYRQLVSRWYRLNDEGEVVDTERSAAKIGDVLLMLRDDTAPPDRK